jgi:hypothetical protein
MPGAPSEPPLLGWGFQPNSFGVLVNQAGCPTHSRVSDEWDTRVRMRTFKLSFRFGARNHSRLVLVLQLSFTAAAVPDGFPTPMLPMSAK